MANTTSFRETILSGKEITIHKEAGKLRPNCIYATSIEVIPEFLITDGAITVNDDGSIILHAIEGPASRHFPVYVCWEEVSAENADKVSGKYGCWPKDNGDETLKVIDGKCYNLPSMVKAVIISETLPVWVANAGFPVSCNENTWELTRTDWGGEIRRGLIGEALWCCYGENDVNILALSEQSASEYIVSIDGEDIGILTELIK